MGWKRSYINFQAFGLLFALFLISVVVRLPNLDRPLSKHHEFVTAVSLRVLQIWETEGGAKYHYAPVMNYPGKENKFINNHASATDKTVDTEGNHYYLSHPPFAYILPHFAFKVLGVKATVMSLQIFHLFINFFSALLIYLLVIALRNNRARAKIDIRALIAFILYISMSSVLWFQSNTYMSDMLVHFFFILGIFTTVKCLAYPNSYKWKIVYAMSLFLMIYTSWLGVIYACVVAVLSLWRWRDRRGGQLTIYSILVSASALCLIFIQYSSICGTEALLEHLMQRFNVRGSNTIETSDGFFYTKLKELSYILFNYAVNYHFYLGLIIVSYVAIRIKKIDLGVPKEFVVLSLIPILVLHVGLMNYSGHDFTVLYASVFVSIAGAYVLTKQEWFNAFSMWSVTALLVLSGIAGYYAVNLPGKKSWKGDTYAISKKQGESIRKNAKPDQFVFFVGELDPMVVVYAKRNMIEVHSDEQLKKAFNRRGLRASDYFVYLEK
jgi:hypothetical protein